MTELEYKDKLKYLTESFEKQKSELQKQFAFSNAKYKIGDIVTDNMGSIIVEQLRYDSGSFGYLPSAVYLGSELKKDGTPKKNEHKRNVWQRNIK